MIPSIPPELQPLERYRHRHNYGKWAQRELVAAKKKKANRKKNKTARKARKSQQ